MSAQTKKKVLFLITKSNWGGAQRYVYDLAINLDHTKYEPVVALGGNGQLVQMLHHAGIRTISIDSLSRDISAKKEWAFAKELWQILRTEKPDIFHVNSSKAGGMGTLLGRLARVPKIIFTAHGWAFNEDRPFWQCLIIKFLHWITVLLSHKTIAVSSAIVKQMNWPGAEAKMKIINPGRTVGPMYEHDEARRKIIDFVPDLQPYQNDPWLVSIAELHPIKRHSILFAAMTELIKIYPNLRLVCIGEGQERAKLEQMILELSLSNNIFLVGAITEAARFLKAFDIFVLASKSESYGYVLHEAGLAKLPVVATNVGGIPDIITDKKDGLLVAPNDPHDLTRALESLVADKDKRQDHGNRLFEKLNGRNVKEMTQKTVYLYNAK